MFFESCFGKLTYIIKLTETKLKFLFLTRYTMYYYKNSNLNNIALINVFYIPKQKQTGTKKTEHPLHFPFARKMCKVSEDPFLFFFLSTLFNRRHLRDGDINIARLVYFPSCNYSFWSLLAHH